MQEARGPAAEGRELAGWELTCPSIALPFGGEAAATALSALPLAAPREGSSRRPAQPSRRSGRTGSKRAVGYSGSAASHAESFKGGNFQVLLKLSDTPRCTQSTCTQQGTAPVASEF